MIWRKWLSYNHLAPILATIGLVDTQRMKLLFDQNLSDRLVAALVVLKLRGGRLF